MIRSFTVQAISASTSCRWNCRTVEVAVMNDSNQEVVVNKSNATTRTDKENKKGTIDRPGLIPLINPISQ